MQKLHELDVAVFKSPLSVSAIGLGAGGASGAALGFGSSQPACIIADLLASNSLTMVFPQQGKYISIRLLFVFQPVRYFGDK